VAKTLGKKRTKYRMRASISLNCIILYFYRELIECS
jgi:hypothetical protein